MRIDLEGGKYTYVLNDDEPGSQYVLRYGEPWRDLIGDKFVYCMAAKIEEQAERIKELEATNTNKDTLIAEQNRLNKERQEWALKTNETIRKQSAALKLARQVLMSVKETSSSTRLRRIVDEPLAAIHEVLKGE